MPLYVRGKCQNYESLGRLFRLKKDNNQ